MLLPSAIPRIGLLESVFQIHCGDGTGSAFSIVLSQSQYLVTAHHLVRELFVGENVELSHKNGYVACPVREIYHPFDDLDVCFLSIERRLPVWMDAAYSSDGLLLGHEVGFLGFPFGMAGEGLDDSEGWPMPLLKKASVAGSKKIGFGPHIFYLDGHNNPGFSGGPVFFTNTKTQKTHIFGVVSGYRKEEVDFGKEEHRGWANAGIVECHPLMPVLSAKEAGSADITSGSS